MDDVPVLANNYILIVMNVMFLQDKLLMLLHSLIPQYILWFARRVAALKVNNM